MYFAVTCSVCGKPVTVSAKDELEARQYLQGMQVCPAGLHPSLPSVLDKSSGFRKAGWFGYLHSGK